MSTPVIFALTRHGEYHQPPGVPSAWLPHPLTEKGQAQAKALGQALIAQADQRSWQLDSRWDCSVLLRAWQTAQLAASCVSGGTEPRLCSSIALGERSLGSAANLSVAQIQEVLAKDPRFEEPAPAGNRSLGTGYPCRARSPC